MMVEALPVVVALAFLGSVVFLGFKWATSVLKQGRSIEMDKVKNAISFLLSRGVDIVLDSKHLYKRGEKFIILVFDKRSNLKYDEEQTFNDENEAIEKFVELTGGKLIEDDQTTED